MAANTVRQERFIDLLSERAPVLSRWSYSPDEPYSITVEFQTSPDDWITWVFARDLLLAGLQAPAGVGDVRFVPFEDEGDRLLLFQVESDQGRASWFLNRDDAEEFATMTLDAVPVGAESEHFDMDALIAGLTDV
ncbi:SsgA family sporulation/cell division regulator [Haloechinothrix halophila]|uniref:Sporulation and cell division SsgA family protein n=1 Tax=Haloechinothrix halophila YIM 93223 TaxID=592678 RepID=W9DNC0_9PSEU|nr:SsgA family sporulation/cell division regulator [Haloechinothrix halophila]ETA66428.1 sporulation and cell division SsgA family protein [Haloechinothrix halophila YIM 93223]